MGENITKAMKKFLKVLGIILGIIVLLLFLAPLLFENQLKNLVQNTINKNLNAEVAFADMDLSLFRSFPDASLTIEDFSVINRAPFKGDTLARGQEVELELNIFELFKSGDEPVKIDAIEINQTLLDLKIDSLGNNNYDIAIEDTTTTGTGGALQFDVERYQINDSRVNYRDQQSGIGLIVEDLNHEGTGDFSAATSELSTVSTALVSLEIDSINYLNRNKVQLTADFMMDLEKMKFTFLENEAIINQLPLTFDGYVQVHEDHNEIDLSFKTPSSSFKNFLAIIPETYSKNIEQVQTQGDFIVQGKIQGRVDDTYIPQMEISIASSNASFKYPDLPEAVEDITIAAEIMNETGLAEDTYVNIEKLNFRIDQDAFSANGSLKNLMGNMIVDMNINGSLNLANLERAYPLNLEQDLNGHIDANISTRFDMESIEKEQYQNVRSSGNMVVEDFRYASPEIPNEIEIETVSLQFDPGNVNLENMIATTGKTDLTVQGNIKNLMGYLFADQKLKGNFTARSNTFSVNDFMVRNIPSEEGEEPVTSESGPEAIKIPSFLDVQLDFQADRVLYDNLVLENTRGNVNISDETAILNQISSDIFGGNILLNGQVTTAEDTPEFKMDLDLKSIDIAQSFRDMELLRNLAPIAEALQGKLITKINLQGDLYENLTPQINTLAGTALAQVLGAQLNPEQSRLLEQLNERLAFFNLEDLNLNNLEAHLTFNNGQVQVQPFDFNIKGIEGTISGTHGFDLGMNYNVALEVPATYLGDELGSLLSQLSSQQLASMTVALPINVTGTFTSPNIALNLDQAVQNLTQKIIDNQKDNLKDRGKDILTGILTGKQSQDTTAQSTTPPDSIPAQREEVVKKTAKRILGNILERKTSKKDSVNP